MTDLTRKEKVSLGTKEIAKALRGRVKAEFPRVKFSVRIAYYSMGSSITVSLMKADRKVKLDFAHIDKDKIARALDSRYSLDELQRLQNGDYHQLNNYSLYGDYDARHWCNGVFLTYQGHNLLRRVVQIVNEYHRDDSDSMTDYYSVNFSFSLELGKWDKPFVDGTGYIADPALDTRISTRVKEIEINTAKAKEEKALKDKMDRLENDHAAKSKRTMAKIRDILAATATFDKDGFHTYTPESRMARILALDEVKQALKVHGLEATKEIFGL